MTLMTQIRLNLKQLWRVRVSRALIVAPSAAGKGLPPGSLPLPGTNPKIYGRDYHFKKVSND